MNTQPQHKKGHVSGAKHPTPSRGRDFAGRMGGAFGVATRSRWPDGGGEHPPCGVKRVEPWKDGRRPWSGPVPRDPNSSYEALGCCATAKVFLRGHRASPFDDDSGARSSDVNQPGALGRGAGTLWDLPGAEVSGARRRGGPAPDGYESPPPSRGDFVWMREPRVLKKATAPNASKIQPESARLYSSEKDKSPDGQGGPPPPDVHTRRINSGLAAWSASRESGFIWTQARWRPEWTPPREGVWDDPTPLGIPTRQRKHLSVDGYRAAPRRWRAREVECLYVTRRDRELRFDVWSHTTPGLARASSVERVNEPGVIPVREGEHTGLAVDSQVSFDALPGELPPREKPKAVMRFGPAFTERATYNLYRWGDPSALSRCGATSLARARSPEEIRYGENPRFGLPNPYRLDATQPRPKPMGRWRPSGRRLTHLPDGPRPPHWGEEIGGSAADGPSCLGVIDARPPPGEPWSSPVDSAPQGYWGGTQGELPSPRGGGALSSRPLSKNHPPDSLGRNTATDQVKRPRNVGGVCSQFRSHIPRDYQGDPPSKAHSRWTSHIQTRDRSTYVSDTSGEPKARFASHHLWVCLPSTPVREIDSSSRWPDIHGAAYRRARLRRTPSSNVPQRDQDGS